MGNIRPFLRQPHISLVFFAASALAALYNVTVDDSAMTGGVVPQYLSSDPESTLSAWHQGNTCTGCAAQPDPAMAYHGTWHDATYSLLQGPFLSFEFSFVGTALYIYFILANAPNYYLIHADTSVNFTLDGVAFPAFVHFPTPGAGYEYNVAVFSHESLVSGTHTMTVQPVVPTSSPTDSVLMLFDYLIYSTDADNTTMTSMPSITSIPQPSTNPSSSPSANPNSLPSANSNSLPSSSESPTVPVPSGISSLRPDVGAIVGGAVAGISAIVLVIVSLLCYWRYKRRQSKVGVTDMVDSEPFFIPTPFEVNPLPSHPMPVGFSPSMKRGNNSEMTSHVSGTSQLSAPPPAITPSASGPSANNVTTLIEEMGMLRSEVARLRERQDQEQNPIEDTRSEAPPTYFTS